MKKKKFKITSKKNKIIVCRIWWAPVCVCVCTLSGALIQIQAARWSQEWARTLRTTPSPGDVHVLFMTEKSNLLRLSFLSMALRREEWKGKMKKLSVKKRRKKTSERNQPCRCVVFYLSFYLVFNLLILLNTLFEDFFFFWYDCWLILVKAHRPVVFVIC